MEAIARVRYPQKQVLPSPPQFNLVHLTLSAQDRGPILITHQPRSDLELLRFPRRECTRGEQRYTRAFLFGLWVIAGCNVETVTKAVDQSLVFFFLSFSPRSNRVYHIEISNKGENTKSWLVCHGFDSMGLLMGFFLRLLWDRWDACLFAFTSENLIF